MGYGAEHLALFQILEKENLFKDINRVVDLGSQEMHFAKYDTTSYPYREIIRSTIKFFGWSGDV